MGYSPQGHKETLLSTCTHASYSAAAGTLPRFRCLFSWAATSLHKQSLFFVSYEYPLLKLVALKVPVSNSVLLCI